MPIVMHCPHCKQRMQLGDDAPGKQFRCPFCKNPFVASADGHPHAAAQQPVAAAAGAAAGRGGAPPAPPRPAAPPPPKPAAATPTACPACGAKLLEGAVSCMDCGYLIGADTGGEMEAAANLCPNPACGVANPSGERYCQRCTTPLRHPPGLMIHGRYKVKRHLATGGFGDVYLAEDTKNGNREVAIKEMICNDPQEFAIRLNFFRREAEVVKSLAPVPVVVRFFDLIEQDKTAHLVLEFIPGKDLLKLMEGNNNKPFPMDQVVEWSKQMCDVLTHMHSLSLVHRDMKPENIMLLSDNKSIKMIDFGTGRDLGKTVKEQQKAKTRVYTEGYAAPEQIIGKPEPRSDLFSLAATMYHLVTGKAPEGFYTAREIEAKLAEPGGIPNDQRWFYDLIRANLAEDMHERYHSAKEIKNDLIKRQVTRETACPKCQASNKVREPYCSKCAEPLTDVMPPCHQCGFQTNRMGSRCCINCGNRLR